jgi:hypothetical protein
MSETITTIQARRGLRGQLPAEAAQGEFLFCLDTHELFFGMGPAITPVELAATAANASSIQSIPVDPTPPTDGKILIYNAGSNQYSPSDPIVSGPDAPNAAPTKNPVQIGAIGADNTVKRLISKNTGELQTNDAAVVAALAGTLVTSRVVSTSGGSTATGYHITTAAVQAIKASAGQLYGYYLDNTANSATTYYQFFNLAAGSVVLGTTVPLFVIPVPAGLAANVQFSVGSNFSVAMSFAATTTYNGNTAVGSAVDSTIWWA